MLTRDHPQLQSFLAAGPEGQAPCVDWLLEEGATPRDVAPLLAGTVEARFEDGLPVEWAADWMARAGHEASAREVELFTPLHQYREPGTFTPFGVDHIVARLERRQSTYLLGAPPFRAAVEALLRGEEVEGHWPAARAEVARFRRWRRHTALRASCFAGLTWERAATVPLAPAPDHMQGDDYLYEVWEPDPARLAAAGIPPGFSLTPRYVRLDRGAGAMGGKYRVAVTATLAAPDLVWVDLPEGL